MRSAVAALAVFDHIAQSGALGQGFEHTLDVGLARDIGLVPK